MSHTESGMHSTARFAADRPLRARCAEYVDAILDPGIRKILLEALISAGGKEKFALGPPDGASSRISTGIDD